ncbi:MAG: hypothetical protein H7296_07550 [Bacteroidia bacterium]|nr:hypothetical protein [Bacteroidia bacterium]
MPFTITQQPATLNLSGNLPDVLITSADKITTELLINGATVLVEEYYPDSDGKIIIELKDLINSLLYATLPPPTLSIFTQQKANANCVLKINNTEASISFRVVKGGLDSQLFNTVQWLQTNFLTWQPQVKMVKYYDPEWLTYYAVEGGLKVMVKGYFANNTSQIIELVALTFQQTQSITTNPGTIQSKFAQTIIGYDIWVASATVKYSFTQRYLIVDNYQEHDHLFVFENNLAGIDTIRFTGDLTAKPDIKTDSAYFLDENLEYGFTVKSAFTKNTGYFKSDREKVFALEFFKSINKYITANGEFKRISVQKATLNSQLADLNAFTFDFIYSKETQYLNIPRPNILPQNLSFS